MKRKEQVKVWLETSNVKHEGSSHPKKKLGL